MVAAWICVVGEDWNIIASRFVISEPSVTQCDPLSSLAM